MRPNSVVHAAALDLDHKPVPARQIVDGAPTTALEVLTELNGIEVGVWEMSTGGMRDLEADEVFVVLSGSARVEFADGSRALELGPGDVARIEAGAKTVWTVTETLRKVYVTG
ncbi:cupin domain-containing protein [Mycolicibacterium litorale]|nr:cupin domain-containing protein [Mycolicibacterium litorale]MCV7416378.1 cupin domain-containing protein [Mycolicibacterium litorale]TDY09632.1 hypothetical protein BCL50_1725 [Mycolicibacterium litorale]